MDLQLEIVNAKSNKALVTVYDVLDTFTVEELKKTIAGKKPKFRDINRLELRTEPKGKPLKDEVTLRELGIKNESIVYFKVQQFCPTQIHPKCKFLGPRTSDRVDDCVPLRVCGAAVGLPLVLLPALARLRGPGPRHHLAPLPHREHCSWSMVSWPGLISDCQALFPNP